MGIATQYPTSNTAVSGTWNNPTNTYSDSGTVVDITRGTTKNSQDDRIYGTFGFDSAIPAGATINSVTLEWEARVQSTANVCYIEGAVRVSSTDGTFNSDSTEPTTLTARSYGSQTRPGGGSWARADLLDGTFEVTLRARNGNNNSSNTWEWDYVRVVVDYSPATNNYTISGSVTATPTVAATVLDFTRNASISGDVTATPTVNATLDYTRNASIAGAVTVTPSVASGMVYQAGTGDYVIAGAVTVTPSVAASLDYTRNADISGDVTVAVAVAAGLDFTSNNQITGDVTITPTVAGLMLYSLHVELAGSVVVVPTANASMVYHAGAGGDVKKPVACIATVVSIGL